MPYSSIETLTTLIPLQELINLTNDEPACEVNAARVKDAINYADEIINSYLRNKYVLPLKFVPPIIVNLSTDIAAFRLYSRRPRKLPEHIQSSYDTAIKILTSIQKEQMILDLPEEHPDEKVTSPAKMIITNKTSSSKIFSDSLMKGFRS